MFDFGLNPNGESNVGKGEDPRLLQYRQTTLGARLLSATGIGPCIL